MTKQALDKWQSQLRKGSLEMAVFASLWDHECYGLEVLKRLEPLEVGEGTLYPLLNRLRRDGYLDSEWETRNSGHPRRYYRLTDAGRDRAREMTKLWRAYNKELRELLGPLSEEELQ